MDLAKDIIFFSLDMLSGAKISVQVELGAEAPEYVGSGP